MPGVRLRSGIVMRQMRAEKKTFILFLGILVYVLIVPLYPGTAGGELPGDTAAAPAGENKEAKEENEYGASGISRLLLQLGEKLSDINSIKTDFVQEKHLAIFKNKIIIKGRMYLRKPGKIAWHVEEPIKYKLLITDKVIRQWDEDTNEINEISGNSIFWNIIDQMTVWFSGNYISLLENYDVHIKKQRPYVLEFIPRGKSIAKKIIKSITVTFREDARYLKQIEFREIKGDTTVIILENTVLNAPLDDSFFRINKSVR